MKTSATLEQVMNSPELPFVVRQLTDALAAEQTARERFYDELTDSMKAEFINGKVIVHSPAKWRHIRVSQNVAMLLIAHTQKNGLGSVAVEKALICLSRNDYEPDISFFDRTKTAGFQGDTMKFPAPDLVVEVLSESTEHRDRGIKFSDYALHGVREYWIIDADGETVEQYSLVGSEYQLKVKLNNGLIRSTVVDGFEIPVRAIFDSDEQQKTLRGILA